MSECALCGRKIKERESLYCGYCNSIFHRACILQHFYYNRFCPVCKREIAWVDLHYGEPEIAAPEPTPYPEILEPPPVQVKVRYEIPARKKSIKERLGITGLKPEGETTILRRFRANRKGMAGFYMLVTAALISVLAPVLIMHDPVIYMVEDVQYLDHPPTWEFPFGTDVMGRDIYSQTVWGFRAALMVSLPSAFLIGVIGTVAGLTSGYYGGTIDAVLQRISVTFLVWPAVPLAILIVFAWGGVQAKAAIIMGVAFSLWPTTARAIRAEVMSLRNRPFIEAAKVSGASSARIVFRHILPNVIHLTFLYMTIAVASALALEAAINFLGLGNPGVITWGQMLSFTFMAARGYVTWWSILAPGLAIAYTVLSFFMISVGLRESIDVSGRY